MTFKILPPHSFGLPQDGHTVLPAGTSFVSDTYDRFTGAIVGHGTLSDYRDLDGAISQDVEVLGLKGKLFDNHLALDVEGATPNEAYARAARAVDSLLMHLAVNQRRSFAFEGLSIMSSSGKIGLVPKPVRIFAVAQYDLSKLGSDIIAAQAFSWLKDAELERALEYFEHGLNLYEERNQGSDPFSRRFRMIISSVFLNIWKAISTLVGDPNKDHDYQSRYKKLGLDYEYFKEKIERLRYLRNDCDVAHYDVSTRSLERIENECGEAIRIASDLISRYRAHLAGGGKDVTP